MTRVPLACLFALSAACVDGLQDARQAEVVSLLARADEPLIRARPDLAAGRYRRMAASLFDYVRGSYPVFIADAADGTLASHASRYAIDEPFVLGIGDVHVENFGTLRAPDGTLALEPNDFDAADLYPYLWEVRRLAVSMVIAARVANPLDRRARHDVFAALGVVARSVGLGYAQAIESYARGAPHEAVGATAVGDDLILSDLFERALEDDTERTELEELTVIDDSGRHLRRGRIDPRAPEQITEALPAFAAERLAETLQQYRASLVSPPPPEELVLLDVVRELGSGVASWSRVRVLLLLRGPTDDPGDDVILELKELADSGATGALPPGVAFGRVEQRVLGSARALWARPDADPRWGTARWLGLPVQLRTVAGAHRTLRVRRLTDDLGTPAALEQLARSLGALLARMHARRAAGGERIDQLIAARLAGHHHDFAAEQEEIALRYAGQLDADWRRFRDALERLGPTLGLEPAPGDAPSAELRAVFGSPPEVEEER